MDKLRIIIVGFAPGEGTDAAVGGFNWVPDTPKNREWAHKEVAKQMKLSQFETSIYMAICEVPAGLSPPDVTEYIENRLDVIEPGFLTLEAT